MYLLDYQVVRAWEEHHLSSIQRAGKPYVTFCLPSPSFSRVQLILTLLYYQFGKALFTSKGPMSSEEAKKNAFKEPLATRAPVRTGSASPSTIHQPPPMRGQQVKEEGLGRARALYDYEKSDATDLGVKEGQEVVVIEHGAFERLA